MRVEDLLQVMDLARVIRDRKLKKYGLVRGDVVIVAGTDMVPVTKQDLYLRRLTVTVAKVIDGKMDKEFYKGVDPRSLQKISDPEEIKALQLQRE